MKNFKEALAKIGFVVIVIVIFWMALGMPGITYLKP
jgi:hypothetical protein